jgi:RNA polymerase sigma factor (sigma-70 family)
VRLAAFVDFQQFKGLTAAEFVGWLRQILHNTIRDFLRSWTAQKRDTRREMTLAGMAEEELPGIPSASSAASEVVRQDFDRFAQQAMESMPEPHRTVLLLVSGQQLSHEEQGDRLGVPVESVTRLVRRAVQALSSHVKARKLVKIDGWT